MNMVQGITNWDGKMDNDIPYDYTLLSWGKKPSIQAIKPPTLTTEGTNFHMDTTTIFWKIVFLSEIIILVCIKLTSLLFPHSPCHFWASPTYSLQCINKRSN